MMLGHAGHLMAVAGVAQFGWVFMPLAVLRLVGRASVRTLTNWSR
jgi:hypothetical protein